MRNPNEIVAEALVAIQGASDLPALEQVKASRCVSPQYNEAMLLAQRGVNAQVIADQCAISIGEAELVAALSRNRQEYEDYDRQIDGRE